MADSHIIAIVVEHKFGVEFVDGVVGEMHVLFIEIAVGRFDILFCCKTS